MNITPHQLHDLVEHVDLGYGKIAAYGTVTGVVLAHIAPGAILASANDTENCELGERKNELSALVAQRETARDGAPVETLPFALPKDERELRTRLKFGLAVFAVYGAVMASMIGYGLSAKKGHYWPLAIPVVTNTIAAAACSRKSTRDIAAAHLRTQIRELEQKLDDFNEE